MNPPTEISPSAQLLLDEIHKLFDKFDTKWELDAVREASRGIPVPTQSAAIGADVVADNWGGLFDGGDDSDEKHCEARSIVADNWGGLFEQPAHIVAQPIVADNWGGLFEQPAHIVEEPAATDATELQQHTRERAPSSRNDISGAVPADALALPTRLVRLDPHALQELTSPPPDDITRSFGVPASESRCPASEEFVSIALDAACAFPAVDAHLLPAGKDEIPNHLDRANSSAVSITPASAPSSATVSDNVLALVVLKSGLSDPAGRLAPWSEDADRVCAWPGDSYDPRMGHVSALNLPAASLAGRLPRSALLRLDALVSLALPGNRLSGTLPDALPPHLRALDFSGNAISGGITASLVSCESLNLPPTRCSMQVHNSNSSSSLLHTSSIAPASTLPTPTAALMTVAPFPASTTACTARVNFSSNIIDNKGMAASRPLTVAFVDVIGPVKHPPVYVLGVANKPAASLDTEWVLDEVPHKQLWPPPVQCEIQSDAVQMVICVAWVPSDENELEVRSFQLQQPWPPPAVLPLRLLPWPSFSNYAASVQFEIQNNGVHLRPMPWPSFGCLTVWCNTCLLHKCLMWLPCCEISGEYWKHWSSYVHKDEMMWIYYTWEGCSDFSLPHITTRYAAAHFHILSAFVSLLASQKWCDQSKLLVLLSSSSTWLHTFTTHVFAPAAVQAFRIRCSCLARIPRNNSLMQLKRGGITQLKLCHLLLSRPNCSDGVLVFAEDSSQRASCGLVRLQDSGNIERKAQIHALFSGSVVSVTGQRLGFATVTILPKPRELSFDPGPLFKLERHYSSNCASLQHASLLLLDNGNIIQRTPWSPSAPGSLTCAHTGTTEHQKLECTMVMSVYIGCSELPTYGACKLGSLNPSVTPCCVIPNGASEVLSTPFFDFELLVVSKLITARIVRGDFLHLSGLVQSELPVLHRSISLCCTCGLLQPVRWIAKGLLLHEQKVVDLRHADMKPWPPPAVLHNSIASDLVEMEIVCDGAKLRPTSWPSFSSRYHLVAGAFTDNMYILRALCTKHGLYSDKQFQQFPWDPGGSILLHRLGGKPNLKGRRMLGTSIGWADAWALEEYKGKKARGGGPSNIENIPNSYQLLTHRVTDGAIGLFLNQGSEESLI